MIDETHIAGHCTFEMAWGEDRTATVKAALDSRFGLLLTADSATSLSLQISW